MKIDQKIAVVGLGYVGLPVAIALAKKFNRVIGFDINARKVAEIRDGYDVTGEVGHDAIRQSSLEVSHHREDMKDATVFIVAVPTPVDNSRNPDLTPLTSASEIVGSVLKIGDLVIYESTVYPGVTEEICGPILERISGLKQGIDFKLGYSPERINPGDKEKTVEKIVKIVSGEDQDALERVAEIYAQIIEAGIHRAPSIKVAEAAKVIENSQRDLNIAFMNELAIIFDRLGIKTKEVLEAARTKWNFLPFSPGLVGGHCIGVDPYYLTTKAQELGYTPQVILAGRRINDSMGQFVANKTIKLVAQAGMAVDKVKVAILGLTFKENISDIRNSRVPDIVFELQEYGIQPIICDPYADRHSVQEEYKLQLSSLENLSELDVVIAAVPHRDYVQNIEAIIARMNKKKAIFVDVKSSFAMAGQYPFIVYWSL